MKTGSITLVATARFEYATDRDLDVISKNLEAAINAAELEGLITEGCEAELAGITMETTDGDEPDPLATAAMELIKVLERAGLSGECLEEIQAIRKAIKS